MGSLKVSFELAFQKHPPRKLGEKSPWCGIMTKGTIKWNYRFSNIINLRWITINKLYLFCFTNLSLVWVKADMLFHITGYIYGPQGSRENIPKQSEPTHRAFIYPSILRSLCVNFWLCVTTWGILCNWVPAVITESVNWMPTLSKWAHVKRVQCRVFNKKFSLKEPNFILSEL